MTTESQVPDHALRAEWVRALVSGEWEQTTYKLCQVMNPEGEVYPIPRFCCLGVLAEIAGERRCFPYPDGSNVVVTCCYGWRGMPAALSQELQTRIGLTTQSELIDMNDEKGASFADIAAYLIKLWNLDPTTFLPKTDAPA